MSSRMPRRSSSAVTISDVAARAGVSAMTVSNVLSGRKKVQDKTREAVESAIRDLGYTPNAAAQALASAAQMRVGLVYNNPQSAFLSALLVGALNAASQLGAQLLIRPCKGEDVGNTGETMTELVRAGAGALLLPPPYCEIVEQTEALRAHGLPIVAISPGRELKNLSGVRIDDFNAARAMTSWLIERGHRRIGFVGGPENHFASQSRMEGYRAALAEANLANNPELEVTGDFSYDSGLIAARRLFALQQRPTAIFATTDDMAAAMVSEAHRLGLDIPGDVSIAGFDDTPIAVKIWPRLTTVRQPIAAISEEATRRAIALIRAPNFSEEKVISMELPFEIVERDSTTE